MDSHILLALRGGKIMITLHCPLVGSLAPQHILQHHSPVSLSVRSSLSSTVYVLMLIMTVVMTAPPSLALKCTQALQLFWWFTASSQTERKREAHYRCLWGELYVQSKQPQWHLHRTHPTKQTTTSSQRQACNNRHSGMPGETFVQFNSCIAVSHATQQPPYSSLWLSVVFTASKENLDENVRMP